MNQSRTIKQTAYFFEVLLKGYVDIDETLRKNTKGLKGIFSKIDYSHYRERLDDLYSAAKEFKEELDSNPKQFDYYDLASALENTIEAFNISVYCFLEKIKALEAKSNGMKVDVATYSKMISYHDEADKHCQYYMGILLEEYHKAFEE